ncbi:uncharacterized protein ATNIH1004_001958 [Aspergillus tanneri]|uniref:Uncharacterized protein n=1 Tax=Aspergillus tanneri TaxID=1220188 RepID=A0A5M9M6Z9_9EURO|nr:uncharacterized protein ATNIH1004_001958 [Aspergillus tanneri]KAA8641356.1 hypothetical protein ATNIH1004_001958 [Aspergillus tanneri]
MVIETEAQMGPVRVSLSIWLPGAPNKSVPTTEVEEHLVWSNPQIPLGLSV